MMRRNQNELSGGNFYSEDIMIYTNRFQEDFDNPHHSHDFLEITIIEEGIGFHHINGKVLPVKKGDIFVIPIGVSHVFRPSSAKSDRKLIVYNVLCDPVLIQFIAREISSHDQKLKEWCSSLSENQPFEYLQLQDKYDICLTIFRSIHIEFQQKQAGYAVILQSKLKELLIHLFRIQHQQNPYAAFSTFVIDDAISYINNHLSENLTTSKLAKLMAVSERHFLRLFKKYTKQTLTEYLQSKRVEKSCELLQITNYDIKEISQMVGYKDTDYYRIIFRKKVGVSPREYRSSVREQYS